MSQFQGIIAPHPVGILPHENNKESLKLYEDLIKSQLELTKKVADFEPDTIVIISPRGNCLLEGITINIPQKNQYISLLEEINKPNQTYEFDKANAHLIHKHCQESNLPVFQIDNEILDYGAIIPLYFLTSKLEKQPELIYLTMGLVNAHKHYKIGKIIQEIFQESNKKVLFIASSTLSAKLTKTSPGGYNKNAKDFDQELISDLNEQNHEAIQNFDPFLLDEVGELAVRPISMLAGFLNGQKLKINKHHYCCPEGVGQLLASTFELTS